jgi:PAS domain S-box-containing protein
MARSPAPHDRKPGAGPTSESAAALAGLDDTTTRLLLESVVGYAIYLIDPSGIVSTWNAGAEKIKGYRADEIVGKSFATFFTPEARAAGDPEKELEAARNGPVEVEGWRVRKNGERFWASLTLTPLYDESGKLRGYAKVTRDMTEYHRAQEERIRLTRAEEALRLRDEFLHKAETGLQQVLAAINAQVKTIKETLGEESARGAAAKLARIEWTLDRVAAIAQNVLQLAADTGEQLVRRSRAVNG